MKVRKEGEETYQEDLGVAPRVWQGGPQHAHHAGDYLLPKSRCQQEEVWEKGSSAAAKPIGSPAAVAAWERVVRETGRVWHDDTIQISECGAAHVISFSSP